MLSSVATSTTVRPLDGYLAALFALVVVVGLDDDPVWRTAFWVVIGVYVVSAFAAAQASPLSLVASPAIGAAVGLAVRYSVGTADERPDARRVAAVLRTRGIDVVRIERADEPGERYRNYAVTTAAGQRLAVEVFDRDLITSGAAYSVWRRVRIRSALSAAPVLSLERVAERRAVLAYAAMAAGVRVPRFVAGVPCGPDAVVLVYEDVGARRLEDPTDDQLGQLWGCVGQLHRAGITHRGLSAERVLVDGDRTGRPADPDRGHAVRVAAAHLAGPRAGPDDHRATGRCRASSTRRTGRTVARPNSPPPCRCCNRSRSRARPAPR